jgi:hypothetical protein
MKNLILVFSLAFCAAAAAPPATLRVLVATGGHPHQTTFYSLFDGYDGWIVDTDSHPAVFATPKQRYDVIVFYDFQDDPSEAARKNLRDFAESGKGLVSLHHAIVDYANWPWWYEEVIGGRFFVKPAAGRPASSAKGNIELTVRPAGKHPITRDLRPFQVWDEAYKGMWIRPEVETILETDNPANDRQVAWISPYKKSRVVYVQLGHDRRVHLHPAYRQLVRNSILWAAGRLK